MSGTSLYPTSFFFFFFIKLIPHPQTLLNKGISVFGGDVKKNEHKKRFSMHTKCLFHIHSFSNEKKVHRVLKKYPCFFLFVFVVVMITKWTRLFFFFSLANNAYSIVTKVSQRSVRAQPQNVK